MLDRAVGVAHVVVLRGAAVRPPGDVIEADLARECVDAVLAELTAPVADRDGAITLESLDTVRPRPPTRPRRPLPVRGRTRWSGRS